VEPLGPSPRPANFPYGAVFIFATSVFISLKLAVEEKSLIEELYRRGFPLETLAEPFLLSTIRRSAETTKYQDRKTNLENAACSVANYASLLWNYPVTLPCNVQAIQVNA
jgi:hypothetical protein